MCESEVSTAIEYDARDSGSLRSVEAGQPRPRTDKRERGKSSRNNESVSAAVVLVGPRLVSHSLSENQCV